MSVNGRSARDVRLLSVGPDGVRSRRDQVAVEEPLEIRLAGPGQDALSVSVTMRTPGDDFELAIGFLHAEGLLVGGLRRVRYCVDDKLEQQFNIVTVDVAEPIESESLTRRFASTAACGICGKATLDDVAMHCEPMPTTEADDAIDADVLQKATDGLTGAQPVFDATGGLHAAGLFDADGNLIVVREDVGRHNAVDKVVGHTLLRPPAASPVILAVSGRLGYEIVQKAVAARVPIVTAVSAPSSLAVDTAERFGVTLVGFARGDSCNVYAHPERLRFSNR
jgi:FdhD protein